MATLRLSRAEYWLLESVVEYRLQVSVLASPDLVEALNKPSHGLDRSELAPLLAEMHRKGWIEFHREDSEEPHAPSIEELNQSLGLAKPFSPESLVYSLTPEGGRIWEEFAAPNWSRFFDSDLPGDGGEGSYTASSRKHLKRYLRLVHHLGVHIKPGTERWSIVHPWQATYWRQLQLGHRVEFEFEDRPENLAGWDEIPHEVIHLREWYRWG